MTKPVTPHAKRGGNKQTANIRDVLSGRMHVLSTGCQWRATSKDLPPKSTVKFCFCRWRDEGTLDRLHHALYVRCREQAEHGAGPTAAIMTIRASKARKRGAPDRAVGLRWWQKDQGQEAPRSGPHASQITEARVHATDIQDCDGGVLLVATPFGMYPFLLNLHADADRSSVVDWRGSAMR